MVEPIWPRPKVDKIQPKAKVKWCLLGPIVKGHNKSAWIEGLSKSIRAKGQNALAWVVGCDN